MNNLVIIGAGGMGRTFYDIAKESIGYLTDFDIKGFIDDNLNSLDGFSGYPPLLSSIQDYIIDKNDVFISSIGNVSSRKRCCEVMIEKGAEFATLIHSTARIGSNVKIGKGTVIGAYTSVGADTQVGKHALIQSYSIIAHDVIIGNWSRIDTHVVCIGGTQVGEEVTIHTGAILNHKVRVGNNACVGANSFVIRSVKEGITVFGNPAKQI